MHSIEDIPIGAENAITREALARKWNTNDRTAREIIAKLRAEDNGDGYVIVSHSNGRGYYRTDNIEQIRHFFNETMNRARHTFRPLGKVRRILKGANTMKTEARYPKLLAWMCANGMTPAKLARRARLPVTAVEQLLTGDEAPRKSTMTAIMRATRCSYDELFGGNEA